MYYKIKNCTTTMVEYDRTALPVGETRWVANLTDSIVDGIRQNKLTVVGAEIKLESDTTNNSSHTYVLDPNLVHCGIVKDYGVKNVTPTVSQILSLDITRKIVQLINVGEATVYIGFDNTVTVLNALYAIQPGKVFVKTIQPEQPIYCISTHSTFCHVYSG